MREGWVKLGWGEMDNHGFKACRMVVSCKILIYRFQVGELLVFPFFGCGRGKRKGMLGQRNGFGTQLLDPYSHKSLIVIGGDGAQRGGMRGERKEKGEIPSNT